MKFSEYLPTFFEGFERKVFEFKSLKEFYDNPFIKKRIEDENFINLVIETNIYDHNKLNHLLHVMIKVKSNSELKLIDILTNKEVIYPQKNNPEMTFVLGTIFCSKKELEILANDK